VLPATAINKILGEQGAGREVYADGSRSPPVSVTRRGEGHHERIFSGWLSDHKPVCRAVRVGGVVNRVDKNVVQIRFAVVVVLEQVRAVALVQFERILRVEVVYIEGHVLQCDTCR
jgi:hypothetical protein